MKAVGVLLLVVTAAVLSPGRLQSQTQRRMSQGEAWRTLTAADRTIYLEGVVVGAMLTETVVLESLATATERQAMSRWTGILADVTDAEKDAVVQLMTRLYSDAANACISMPGMVFLAFRRIKGLSEADLTELLKSARSSDALCGT
jgi:hypothetical protein